MQTSTPAGSINSSTDVKLDITESSHLLLHSDTELTSSTTATPTSASIIFTWVKVATTLSLLLFFYVAYSEATHQLSVAAEPYKKPWMINWIACLGSSIALPLYLLSRRASAFVNKEPYVPVNWSLQLKNIGSDWEKIIFWSICLSLAFNVQAYTFDFALQTVPASTVISVFSGVSAGVVYLLSLWLLPHEKFSLLKIIAIIISVAGVFIYAYVDRHQRPAGGGSEAVGIAAVVICSFVYPVWAVGLCVALGAEENLALTALFTSLVGIEALLYIPVFVLLNFTGVETLALPSKEVLFAFFVADGCNIGMNIAWIFALVIVSPIWTSIVTMLAMPATGLYDHFYYRTDFPLLKIIGTIGILIGFAIVNFPEPKALSWENLKRTFGRKRKSDAS